MNEPLVVEAASMQDAYLDALVVLRHRGWECWNLAVQVTDASLFDAEEHRRVEALAEDLQFLSPKHVAYTIFPERLARRTANPTVLRDRYVDRMYPRIKTSWGTYFHRLVAYGGRNGVVDQLGSIIEAVNRTPDRVYRASFTMILPYPGGETRRRRGGPCLNYLAFQLERNPEPTANLLAVYRNHDFLQKAYGNYLGLCQMLTYFAGHIDYGVGRLTCYSSHAYADADHDRLVRLLEDGGR